MAEVEQVAGFIQSSFRSVWSLELLLLLKRQRRRWAPAELLSALRASESVVSQAVDALIAAGLATADLEGVAYMPVSAAVSDLADQAEDLYARFPDRVRRLIVSPSNPGLTAFADAFRLRKD